MNEYDDYSDEQLQAFIDDEIGTHERAEIMQAVRQDDALACRVCELLQLKDSVRLAYRDLPQPAEQEILWHAARKARVSLKVIAAAVLFATGSLTGWVLQSHTDSPHGRVNQLVQAESAHKRVILHIGSADTQRLEKALDDAELLLAGNDGNPGLVQLEVVANAGGLALLRTDTSPFIERIRNMVEDHDNVDFFACSRTIEKLRLKGITVKLVPEATVIPEALKQVVDRIQDGWIYIRV